MLLYSSGDPESAGQKHEKAWSQMGTDWEIWMRPVTTVRPETAFCIYVSFAKMPRKSIQSCAVK